jgi:hypothetical protein
VAVLPPVLTTSADGGVQLGLGGRSWQVVGKHIDDSHQFGPVSYTVDGGLVTAVGMRQGCAGAACSYIAPGLFVALGTDSSSPPVAVRFEALERPSLDVRLGFVEAQPDGGLGCFRLIEDQATSDLFFGDWGCDGLAVHLILSSPTTSNVTLSLMAANSSFSEPLRTDLSARWSQSALPSAFPETLQWRLVPDATGADLVVQIGADALTAHLSTADLSGAPNSDGVAFEGGALDLTRLVPVMFVGWDGLVAPDVSNELTFSLEGTGLDVEPQRVGALDYLIDVQAVDPQNQAVSRGDSLRVELGETPLPIVALDGGAARFALRLPGPGEWALRLQSTTDQWLRGQATLTGERDGTQRRLAVGCGCSELGASEVWLVLLWLARRCRSKT